MLKHCIRTSFKQHSVLEYIYRTYCSTKSKEVWDLLSAVCIERKPIITPKLTPIEEEFKKYLSDFELRRSMKSLHEVRHEQDLLQAELLKKGELADTDIDINVKQTAQDFEDACVDEVSKFKLSSRETDVDKKNDVTSLERRLDRNLVLLVEQQIGQNKHFLLPQVKREEGETMRQAAERALNNMCGPDLKVLFYGNAPSGFYKYKYPKASKENAVGAKIFFYMARYIQGDLSNKSSQFKWLDRKELETNLPSEYHQSVNKFLIDERL